MKIYRVSKGEMGKVLFFSLAVIFVVNRFTLQLGGGLLYVFSLLISCLSPWRYIWWELRIDEKYVSWYALWNVRGRKIEYDKAKVGSYISMGKYYKVFSEEDLENMNRKAMKKLIRQKKAFAFPWNPQMRHDFPELFAREREIRPPQPGFPK